jgi:hypothetical protein
MCKHSRQGLFTELLGIRILGSSGGYEGKKIPPDRGKFSALFTELRGRGILRTSPFRNSQKFAKKVWGNSSLIHRLVKLSLEVIGPEEHGVAVTFSTCASSFQQV